MKKIFFTILALAVTLPFFAFGAEFKADDQVSVQGSESDLYIAGGTVFVSGAVKGDLHAAGGTITLTGSTSGDVLAAGGNLTILGTIGDDLRMAGGSVTINSRINGDAIVAGGQVHFSSDGRLDGNLYGAGGNINIESPILGNITIRGGKVIINSEVRGDIDIIAGEVIFGEKSIIRGNVKYKAEKEAQIIEGSQILGKIEFTEAKYNRFADKGFFFPIFVMKLLKLLATLVTALVFVLVFKRMSASITTHALGQFGRDLLTGFIISIVVPVAAILLFATIIGIPLGLISLFSYILLMIMGAIYSGVIFGIYLEKWIRKKQDPLPTWKNTLSGVVILGIISLVPIIGWIVQCVFMLAAIGAIGKLWLEKRWANR